ncbi:6-O-methylguanine DNA methyltransferase [Aspergillus multicolor]|uniref:MGMT family protein n=1 Tax=Aspergillus multicolor TaxID=41759 RepID=UPI003CCE4200
MSLPLPTATPMPAEPSPALGQGLDVAVRVVGLGHRVAVPPSGPHASAGDLSDHRDRDRDPAPPAKLQDHRMRIREVHKEPDHDASATDTTSPESQQTKPSHDTDTDTDAHLKQTLTKKITQHPTLTRLRKTLYLCLLQIPRGQWTTYAALAKHVGSSARAVGTAMRLNPFAPEVPCHRVLGSDGGLGGYMGTPPAKASAQSKTSESGRGGNLERKRRMLEEEGVRFDSRGKAMGRVFVGFTSTL